MISTISNQKYLMHMLTLTKEIIEIHFNKVRLKPYSYSSSGS